MYFHEDNGKSPNLLRDQLSESGLEMHWLGAVLGIGQAVAGMAGASAQQSAQNKQIKINYEAAKENWEYENESAERKVDFIREQNQITRENNMRNAKFQDATALQGWQYSIQKQDFSYATELHAKLVSDQRMSAQLNQNRMAVEGARAQQNNWMREQQYARDFAIGDQNLILASAEGAMGNAFNDILTTLARDSARLTGQMSEVQHSRNRDAAMIAFKSQESIVESLVNAGSAQNLQAGRSGSKAIQSAEAKGGRAEAMLTQQATDIFKLAAISLDGLDKDLFWANQTAATNRKRVGQEYLSKAAQVSYDKDKINQSYRSALGQHQLNMHDIQQNFMQANLNAHAQNMLMPLPGPKPPPPYATPLPEILDPYDHVWSPKPKKGASVSGGVMSAAASALPGVISGFQSAGWID